MTDKEALIGMGFVLHEWEYEGDTWEDVLLKTSEFNIEISLHRDGSIRQVDLCNGNFNSQRVVWLKGITNWQEVRQLLKYITGKYPETSPND